MDWLYKETAAVEQWIFGDKVREGHGQISKPFLIIQAALVTYTVESNIAKNIHELLKCIQNNDDREQLSFDLAAVKYIGKIDTCKGLYSIHKPRSYFLSEFCPPPPHVATFTK